MALTLWQRRQAAAPHQVEVLEAGQLPEAFGQQTGEQLVRNLFLHKERTEREHGNLLSGRDRNAMEIP